MKFRMSMDDGTTETFSNVQELRDELYCSAEAEYYEEVLEWAKNPYMPDRLKATNGEHFDLWEKE